MRAWRMNNQATSLNIGFFVYKCFPAESTPCHYTWLPLLSWSDSSKIFVKVIMKFTWFWKNPLWWSRPSWKSMKNACCHFCTRQASNLKCCLRENPNGFPIKMIMHMLEKCKLVQFLYIELIKQHKFDLQPLFTCLMGHTIELKVCLYSYRDGAKCESTFLISPERSAMQNPRKVKPSVPDSFVHIDLKPLTEDFMKNCATPCKKCVNVQNQTQWWLNKDE